MATETCSKCPAEFEGEDAKKDRAKHESDFHPTPPTSERPARRTRRKATTASTSGQKGQAK